ncbi:hypothetical protein QBC46DRAFT_358576 [Diplogelasinospora grovesii]|uniref:Uncharacterized protein n=1 Tax=Diplogelasinospora grovesii TaxID=303347 RepID=A0AAN6MX81_9PEZI|nr:hypothetical protein QBC46DRAFT_358576 [Diplogelasinospora grovesii]
MISAAPWGLAISGLIASAVLVGSMAALLAVYDGKPIFSWHGVNLNAIVSILSTASKATVIYTVAEATGQWKWILFGQRQRRLMDFEHIDAASRGPMGSFFLLLNPRFRGGAILRFGVLISLLAVAIDPFSQQLIQYKQGTVSLADDTVTIPLCRRYSKGSEYSTQDGFTMLNGTGQSVGVVGSAHADADFNMQSAVFAGLSLTETTLSQQLPLRCPSGNCTWEPFLSLSVCSECNNVTSQLTRQSCDNCSDLFYFINQPSAIADIRRPGTLYVLPNGLVIENFDDEMRIAMTLLGTTNSSETVSFRGMKLDTLIWGTSIIRAMSPINSSISWPDTQVDALECGLYYCVNRYESAVQNGVLNETINEVAGATRNPNSWVLLNEMYLDGVLNDTMRKSIAYDPMWSTFKRSDLMLDAGPSDRFNISQVAVDSISSFFQTQFASDTLSVNFSSNPPRQRLNGYYDALVDHYAPSMAQVLYNTAVGDIPLVFGALATSMNNALRAGADTESEAQLVRGKLGVEMTYYRIEWAWFALHGVIVTTAALFLIATMRKTRQRGIPVWKSSSLPVMSCELDVLEHATSLDEMKNTARRRTVQLEVLEGTDH